MSPFPPLESAEAVDFFAYADEVAASCQRLTYPDRPNDCCWSALAGSLRAMVTMLVEERNRVQRECRDLRAELEMLNEPN